MPQRILAFSTFAFLILSGLVFNQASAEEWRIVSAPEIWKRPPGEIEGAGKGFAWYRCLIKAPAAWKGRKLTLIAESAGVLLSVTRRATRCGPAVLNTRVVIAPVQSAQRPKRLATNGSERPTFARRRMTAA